MPEEALRRARNYSSFYDCPRSVQCRQGGRTGRDGKPGGLPRFSDSETTQYGSSVGTSRNCGPVLNAPDTQFATTVCARKNVHHRELTGRQRKVIVNNSQARKLRMKPCLPNSLIHECQQRYRDGEWRAVIFRDLVLRDINACHDGATLLDIGCGSGFDGSKKLQEGILRQAAVAIGIEPDPTAAFGTYFTDCQRTTLEQAVVNDSSIDVAYAVMVLEHLADPTRFFSAVHRILKPQGVFWGFTVHHRHYFGIASHLLEAIRLKRWYLDRVLPDREGNRYRKYPTLYRCNSPRRIAKYTAAFSHVDWFGLTRPGEVVHYAPSLLAPLLKRADTILSRLALPGYLLVLRCEK